MSDIYIDLNSPTGSEIVNFINELENTNENDLTAVLDDPIVSFWPDVLEKVKTTTHDELLKRPALPITRIRRIMKIDDTVDLVTLDTTVLFAKACEIFIEELTMRAWVQTKETLKRTMHRSDIATAVSNYEQFDFLVDIVPRKEKPRKKKKKKSRKKRSSEQIAENADGDENDKNKANTTETPQAQKNKKPGKTGTSTKESEESSDTAPVKFGTVEILREFILSNGEIRHVPYHPPQMEGFLLPQTPDGNYEPLFFNDIISSLVEPSLEENLDNGIE